MKLEEAEVYAFKVVNAISYLCEGELVVGSIRRRRPTVNDVDIVVLPKDDSSWKQIPKALFDKLHAKIVRKGPELIAVELPDAHGKFESTDPFKIFGKIQVDIYRATQKTWGIITLVRTGSKEHNVMLCSKAKRLGLMLSAKDGVVQGTRVIASETEEAIFKALQLEYVPPEQREIERMVEG